MSSKQREMKVFVNGQLKIVKFKVVKPHEIMNKSGIEKAQYNPATNQLTFGPKARKTIKFDQNIQQQLQRV